MKRTYVCTRCGRIIFTTSTEHPVCDNQDHPDRPMVAVGDPEGVTRRVLQAMRA